MAFFLLSQAMAGMAAGAIFENGSGRSERVPQPTRTSRAKGRPVEASLGETGETRRDNVGGTLLHVLVAAAPEKKSVQKRLVPTA